MDKLFVLNLYTNMRYTIAIYSKKDKIAETQFPLTDNPGDSKAFIKVQEELERQGKIHHCKVGEAESIIGRRSELYSQSKG